MVVRVGTRNRMKLEAARRAFARFFSGARIVGADVGSGVSPQPVSFGEILRGARERARRAFRECDFSVGIEAGTFRLPGTGTRPFQVTLACIFDGTREGIGGGPFCEVPEGLVRRIVRSDTGAVAVVTRGRLTRAQVTRDAVLMALAPFVSPELYQGEA
ncbi:MAG: DUF84 family protein [Planctomycetota bacterium]